MPITGYGFRINDNVYHIDTTNGRHLHCRTILLLECDDTISEETAIGTLKWDVHFNSAGRRQQLAVDYDLWNDPVDEKMLNNLVSHLIAPESE